MKALVVRTFGPPEGHAIEDWPSGDPGPDAVKVRVQAAGISFFDTVYIAGKYQLRPELPIVPGCELAGEVIAVGSAVTDLAPGDRVCGGMMGGAFAEEAVLPRSDVQKLPPAVPIEQAAVVRGAYITAWCSLIAKGRMQAGETVLVLGAAGSVGIAACQIARHLGATVIASASTPEKRAMALANGAHHAVDSHAADWRDQIKTLTDGRGVDIVIDGVGGELTERAFRSLAWNGRHMVVGYASGTIPKLPVNLALLKGASLIGVDVRQIGIFEPDLLKTGREEVMRLFEAGAIQPPIARTYPFADFADAINEVAAGTSAGRIVLRL